MIIQDVLILVNLSICKRENTVKTEMNNEIIIVAKNIMSKMYQKANLGSKENLFSISAQNCGYLY
jgi:hypothetical protein